MPRPRSPRESKPELIPSNWEDSGVSIPAAVNPRPSPPSPPQRGSFPQAAAVLHTIRLLPLTRGLASLLRAARRRRGPGVPELAGELGRSSVSGLRRHDVLKARQETRISSVSV